MRSFEKDLHFILILMGIGAGFPFVSWGQTISTVAGNATPGYSGDGGPATLSSLTCPNDLAFDSHGNLYISDACALVVRKVDAVTGHITTVAGKATPGYSGDGGLATSAELNYPAGIALDGQDNLYIADYYNGVVRKVWAAGGNISTVVGSATPGYSGDGGPAIFARLGNPQGIRFDNQGRLLVSDPGDHVVRQVDLGTGLISTVVGSATPGYSGDNGPATLAAMTSPEGMVVDPSGNLYITDDGTYVVRKVAAGTNNITTVAGSATPGYSGDNGPATLANLSVEFDSVAVGCGGDIYLADGSNNRVRRLSGTPATITTVVGTGTPGYSGDGGSPLSAQVSHPEALLFDNNGDLYIADYDFGLVRKVDSFCSPTPTPSPTKSPTSSPTTTPTPIPPLTLTPTETFTTTPSPSPTWTPGSCDPIDTYLYPNPATGDNATIFCNLCDEGPGQIYVYNSATELLMTQYFQGVRGVNKIGLPIGHFAHGVYYYFVRVQGSLGKHRSASTAFAVIRP